MRYIYLYILASSDKTNIQVGVCRDLEKLMSFYNGMPSLYSLQDKTALQKVLVYVEMAEEARYEEALLRVKDILRMTYAEKREFIEVQNPTWCDYTKLPEYPFKNPSY
jgi:predicted GIY-YIG superfamily endonuclease